MTFIPLKDCHEGYLYEIHSRNLDLGVFDGKGGFIGIREKFGRKYLFTEYHVETGAPYGTVSPTKELVRVPDGIEVKESLGTVDSESKRRIEWNDKENNWFYIDTNEPFRPLKGNKGFALEVFNDALFDFLNNYKV